MLSHPPVRAAAATPSKLELDGIKRDVSNLKRGLSDLQETMKLLMRSAARIVEDMDTGGWRSQLGIGGVPWPGGDARGTVEELRRLANQQWGHGTGAEAHGGGDEEDEEGVGEGGEDEDEVDGEGDGDAWRPGAGARRRKSAWATATENAGALASRLPASRVPAAPAAAAVAAAAAAAPAPAAPYGAGGGHYHGHRTVFNGSLGVDDGLLPALAQRPPSGPDSVSSLDSRSRWALSSHDAGSLGLRDPLFGGFMEGLARADPSALPVASHQARPPPLAPAASADPPFAPARAPVLRVDRAPSDADSNPAKRQRTGPHSAVVRTDGVTQGDDLEDVVPPSLLSAMGPFEATPASASLHDELRWLDSALASLGAGV